jgi:hypothetical protein
MREKEATIHNETITEAAKIRKVMIATPCHTGDVRAEYVGSLLETLRVCPPDIQIFPVIFPGESLVQHARNKLFQIFQNSDADDLFWIDADMAWNAESFFKILKSDKPLISGVYTLKTDKARVFVYRPIDKEVPDKDGILKVMASGMGFMRMKGEVARALWKAGRKYTTQGDESRMVAEVYIGKDGGLVSEDVAICHESKHLNYPPHVDTTVHVVHIGPKAYF